MWWILRSGERPTQCCIETMLNTSPTVRCHPSPGPGRCFSCSRDIHIPPQSMCSPVPQKGMSWSIFSTSRLSGAGKGRPVVIGPRTHKFHFSPTRKSLWIYSPQSDRWEQLSNVKAWGKNTYSKMFPVLLWNYGALLTSAFTGWCCSELGLVILGKSGD